jgi:hypothetical protein
LVPPAQLWIEDPDALELRQPVRRYHGLFGGAESTPRSPCVFIRMLLN